MALTATDLTTSWKVYSCHLTFWSAWNWRSSLPWVLSFILGLRSSDFLSRSQSRFLLPLAGQILASLRTSERNPCFPPHLVVAKWLANVTSFLTRCRTEWRVVCPTMVSSGTSYIRPLTISVMAGTVVVISAMVAPFVCYK